MTQVVTTYNFSLPQEMLDNLRRLAAERDPVNPNVSALIREAITRHIANDKERNKQ